MSEAKLVVAVQDAPSVTSSIAFDAVKAEGGCVE